MIFDELTGYVTVSYAREDGEYVERLAAYLRGNGVPVRFDEQPPGGERWRDHGESEVEHAAALVVVVSAYAAQDWWVDEAVRHARRRGVEVLATVRDGQPWPSLGDVPVMPEALLLARARHLVARRPTPPAPPAVTRSPWPDAAVLAGLGLVQRPEPVARVAAALLAPGGAPMVGVHGDAGAGKSVVARLVCARWDISASFPGGLVWVDLGPGRLGADLAATIGDLCVAVGGDHPGPVGPVEAGRVLGDLLAARPATLVVLDDARVAEQLDPFLSVPAGYARFLVTTRSALVLSRAGSGEAGDRLAELVALDPGPSRQVRLADAPLTDEQRRRAYELAIFPEGVDLDLSMVALLWAATGGFSLGRTRELLTLLAEVNVVQDLRPSAGTARLPGAVHDELARQVATPPVQAAFLSAAATQYAIGAAGATRQWWRLPASASYLWRHLVHHLAGADRSAELDALLADPRWAQAKLLGVGASWLDADLARSADPTVAALRRAIVRELPLLGPVVPEHSHADILAARLSTDPALRRVVTGLGERTWGVRLRPGWRLPDSADPAARAVLTGHDGRVTGVAISPEGTLVVSTSYDKTVGVWEAASGHRRATLTGHTDVVAGVAFARDGTWLASGGWDGTVRLWDQPAGQEQATLRHPQWVTAVAVAPDGTWLAAAGADGAVRLWDTANGTLRRTLTGHIGSVLAVAAAPDASWLATGGVDRTVRLWDIDGSEVTVLTGHDDAVTGVAVAPDSTWLASASEDGTVRLWSLTGDEIVLSGHTGAVTGVAVAPDGTWLASVGRDRTVRQWDVATGTARATLAGHTDGVTALAIAPDGSFLATSGDDHTVRLWGTATADQPTADQPTIDHSGPLTSLAADGRWVATGGQDGAVRLWDAGTGRALTTLGGPGAVARAVALAPDGPWLVCGHADSTVRLWDLATGTQRGTLAGHTAGVTGVAVAPDGTWFATTSEDASVRLWGAAGEARATLTGHTGAVTAVAIAPDGGYLATAGADHTVRLWSVDSARNLRQLGRRTVSGAHPGPVLAGHTDAVTAVAIAPDGTWLASCGRDRTVRLWEASGAYRDLLHGHDDAVLAVAIAPDGARLVTVSLDHTLRVWDALAGVNVATMRVVGPLWAVGWSPDGRSVFAAGQHGPYRFDLA